MLTIHDHKKLLSFLFLITVCLFSEKTIGQEQYSSKKKANYSLYLYAGGGVSRYVTSFPATPGIESRGLIKPIGCFRIMWQTDHRLALGIETGFITWYSYDAKHDTVTGKLKLTSIPLLITWSMPIAKQFKVFAGFGSYIMTTHLDGQSEVSSKTLSIGWSLAGCYLQPLTKDLSLAYELKLYNAHETRDGLVSLQVHLAWKFLQW